MKRVRFTLIELLVVSMSPFFAAASAGETDLFAQVPEISITPIGKQITDGVRTAEEDAGVMGMYGFHGLHEMNMLPADAWFNIGTDGKNLLLSAVCECGDSGILQRSPAGRGGERAFLDDSFEFILAPDPDAKFPTLYHLYLNNKGSFSCLSKKGSESLLWEPQFTVNGTVKNKQWTFELSLPLAQFGIRELSEGKSIGFRFCRNWRRLTVPFGGDWGKQSSWNQIRSGFFTVQNLPKITFRKNAPVVRQLSLRNGNAADIRFSIFNPTGTPMKVLVTGKVKPVRSQPSERLETITLAAGETKIVRLPADQLTPDENVQTVIRITDPHGKKVFFHRSFLWKIQRETMFPASAKDAQRLSVNYSYFPEYDTLYAVADVSMIPNAEKITGFILTIADKSGKVIARTQLAKGRENISRTYWKIPSLKEITRKTNPSGEYTLTVVAEGISGCSVVKTFERKVFDWEGNPLGRSDILLKPFTAIDVKENQVSVVLRKHTMNSLGLWNQVEAEGKNLLVKGMTISAVINGKTVEAKGEALEWIRITPVKAVAKAKWSAGALKASAICDWDYDGLMKYTLTLEKTQDPVDALSLTVSIDPQYAYLFHACADGLRFNYGGAMPGKWESRQASRMGIQTSYIPYIWLGTETAGLSVFGENDKGWVPDKKISAQTVIRKKDSVDLTLNLIARPVKLTETCTITIGFQATPVKPMPENWRLIGFNCRWNYRDVLNPFIVLVGCDYGIGGIGNSNDLFPRDFDLSLWEELRKTQKTGKITPGFIEKWLAGYHYDGAAATLSPETVRRSINGAFAGRKSNGYKYPYMVYSNARGTRTDLDGAMTFQDSWFIDEFQSGRDKRPEYGSTHTYGVDPCDSYRDFAMYWYNKMLAMGITDKLYWDNTYLSCNYNRVGTDGYELEDGHFQATMGLWNLRELIRRAAVMMTEMGKEPMNMIHMTNTAIMPVAAFAQLNYDWEDNSGMRPFQKRYTKEYVRAVSLGRQSGNKTFVIGAIAGSSDKNAIERCERSKTGVTSTHELSVMPLPCYAFGYGKPDVTVWNYWDKNYPVKISGDTSSILMTKKDAAQLIVCSYSAEDGEYTAEIDPGKTGLSGKFTAKNVETGEQLNVEGNKIFFRISGYDYILIKIEVIK